MQFENQMVVIIGICKVGWILYYHFIESVPRFNEHRDLRFFCINEEYSVPLSH